MPLIITSICNACIPQCHSLGIWFTIQFKGPWCLASRWCSLQHNANYATRGWTRILSLCFSPFRSCIWQWKNHKNSNIFLFLKLEASNACALHHIVNRQQSNHHVLLYGMCTRLDAPWKIHELQHCLVYKSQEYHLTIYSNVLFGIVHIYGTLYWICAECISCGFNLHPIPKISPILVV